LRRRKRNKKWGGARHEVALESGQEKGPNGETNIPRGVILLLKNVPSPKTFLVFVIVAQQKL
jgi:hypothetical protein